MKKDFLQLKKRKILFQFNNRQVKNKRISKINVIKALQIITKKIVLTL